MSPSSFVGLSGESPGLAISSVGSSSETSLASVSVVSRIWTTRGWSKLSESYDSRGSPRSLSEPSHDSSILSVGSSSKLLVLGVLSEVTVKATDESSWNSSSATEPSDGSVMNLGSSVGSSGVLESQSVSSFGSSSLTSVSVVTIIPVASSGSSSEPDDPWGSPRSLSEPSHESSVLIISPSSKSLILGVFSTVAVESASEPSRDSSSAAEPSDGSVVSPSSFVRSSGVYGRQSISSSRGSSETSLASVSVASSGSSSEPDDSWGPLWSSSDLSHDLSIFSIGSSRKSLVLGVLSTVPVQSTSKSSRDSSSATEPSDGPVMSPSSSIRSDSVLESLSIKSSGIFSSSRDSDADWSSWPTAVSSDDSSPPSETSNSRSSSRPSSELPHNSSIPSIGSMGESLVLEVLSAVAVEDASEPSWEPSSATDPSDGSVVDLGGSVGSLGVDGSQSVSSSRGSSEPSLSGSPDWAVAVASVTYSASSSDSSESEESWESSWPLPDSSHQSLVDSIVPESLSLELSVLSSEL